MAIRTSSFRLYHAALLDYVRDSSESSLAHAYEIGRSGLNAGVGLLHILHWHYDAVNTILDTMHAGDEFRRRVNASTEFLMEAVSPFEMAYQGYRSGLKGSTKRHRRPTSPLSSRRQ
jgi:hypothetical protein